MRLVFYRISLETERFNRPHESHSWGSFFSTVTQIFVTSWELGTARRMKIHNAIRTYYLCKASKKSKIKPGCLLPGMERKTQKRHLIILEKHGLVRSDEYGNYYICSLKLWRAKAEVRDTKGIYINTDLLSDAKTWRRFVDSVVVLRKALILRRRYKGHTGSQAAKLPIPSTIIAEQLNLSRMGANRAVKRAGKFISYSAKKRKCNELSPNDLNFMDDEMRYHYFVKDGQVFERMTGTIKPKISLSRASRTWRGKYL